MSKQLSFMQILKNRIYADVESFVWRKSNHYPDITNIKLEHSNEFSVNWSANAKVQYNNYELYGWMDEKGNVYICSVSFDRTKAKPNCDEWWKKENQIPYHGFVYGDSLRDFTFSE